MSKNLQAANGAQELRDKLFSTPFSPLYWRCAAGEFGKLRTVIVAALFIALRIAVSSFFIPVGENLRIFFSFFVNALGSILYGPLVALPAGAIADLLGYVIAPSGAFFLGYTLTAMTGSFLYAIFLYRAKITAIRLVFCKLAVSLIANIVLNSLWSAILYGKGYLYYLVKSVIKNLVLLPFEVWLLFLFLQIMLPVAAKLRLIPAAQGTLLRFSFFSRSRSRASRFACFSGVTLMLLSLGVLALNRYQPLGVDMSAAGFVLLLCAFAVLGLYLLIFGVAHAEKMDALRALSERQNESGAD